MEDVMSAMTRYHARERAKKMSNAELREAVRDIERDMRSIESNPRKTGFEWTRQLHKMQTRKEMYNDVLEFRNAADTIEIIEIL